MAEQESLSGVSNDGTHFEAQVADVLRLLPGARLELGGRRLGKVADMLLHVRETARRDPRSIAVECKDYARPLSRSAVVAVLSDYRDLLDRGAVDSFMLVTRNGVGPNAQELFDGSKVTHFRYSELFSQVMDLTPLVQDMLQAFTLEKLDEYYEPVRCRESDIHLLLREYDAAFCSFIDFSLQSADSLNEARIKWKARVGRLRTSRLIKERLIGESDAFIPRQFASVLRARGLAVQAIWVKWLSVGYSTETRDTTSRY